MNCLCCDKKLEAKLSNFTFYCSDCKYWASNLVPDIESETLQISTSSDQKTEINISHLDSIRRFNFENIIHHIRNTNITENPSILDIGCGSGLFIAIAQELGCTTLGIEPNKLMFDLANNQGLNVRKGLFPEQLGKDEKFDVIIMNDVFEHLDNNTEILQAIPFHLNKGGSLILNIPNAQGLIFQIAAVLQKFGFSKIWDRLWQKMFYTPHLHYFTSESIAILLRKHGFHVVKNNLRLETLSITGLWKRISVDPDQSIFFKFLIFTCSCVIIPILRFGNPDSIILTAKIGTAEKDKN